MIEIIIGNINLLVSALSSELQKLLDEAYALLKEKESEKDSLGKSMSEELSKVKAESEKALNEARTKIAIAQTEFETQLSVLMAKLQLAESKLETEKQNVESLNKENSQTIIDLNSKLISLQAAVDDKTLELNKGTHNVMIVMYCSLILFAVLHNDFSKYFIFSNGYK